MSVAENIKKLREARHLTQSELAAELGVVQQFIAAIERGRKNPSLQMAIDIADFFGITIDELTNEIPSVHSAE